MKELYLRCALIDVPCVGDEMWDSFYDWLAGRGFRNAKFLCLIDGEIATLLSDEDVERLRYAPMETPQ